MDRRSAIRNLSIAAAGTLLWAGCKEQYVNVLTLYQNGQLNLDDRHKIYLNAISDAFLPLRELAENMDRPADFIMRMINDMQPPDQVLKFARGFEAYKGFMRGGQQNLESGNPKVAVALVQELVASEAPMDDLLHFVHTVRGYSIWNLKSSEHYMTEFQEYKMVPPAFNGNVSV